MDFCEIWDWEVLIKFVNIFRLEEGLRRKLRTYLEKISLDLEKEKEREMQWEC
jgi:hypothetical protein